MASSSSEMLPDWSGLSLDAESEVPLGGGTSDSGVQPAVAATAMAAPVARYAGSGNIVDVDLTGGIDAFAARCRIGIALGVPLDRVRLVSLVTQQALPNSGLVPAEISVCLLALDPEREEAAEQQLVQLIGQFDGTANMEELTAAESLDL